MLELFTNEVYQDIDAIRIRYDSNDYSQTFAPRTGSTFLLFFDPGDSSLVFLSQLFFQIRTGR